jgi:hypothetical protein
VEADDRGLAILGALIDVVEPQAVDLGVVRLELEAGQALETLVGGAKDVHKT